MSLGAAIWLFLQAHGRSITWVNLSRGTTGRSAGLRGAPGLYPLAQRLKPRFVEGQHANQEGYLG